MKITDPETLRKLLLSADDGLIGFDTETVGIIPHGCVRTKKGKDALVLDRARMIVASFAVFVNGKLESAVVPLYEQYAGKHMRREELVNVIRPIFASPNVTVVAHNMNYDMNVCLNHGVEIANPECSMILGTCFNENYAKTLKDRAVFVGMMLQKTKTIDFQNTEQISEYAEQDAVACLLLYKHYLAATDEDFPEENRWIWENVEKPLIPVITDMERLGLKVDTKYIRKLYDELMLERAETERKIFNSAGMSFNLASPSQLADVLYNKLGIPAPDLKAANSKHPPTDSDSLYFLREYHEIVDHLIEFRGLEKLRTSYLDPDSGLLSYCDPAGFIHAGINQAGTLTGRMSSSNPNAQQIPARSAWGKKIRKAFIAPDGYRMICVDYSLFELRIVANYCLDPVMLAVFNDPKGDIHSTTAEALHVTRPIAKGINFGLIYGMGARKLYNELVTAGNHVTEQDARRYRAGFHSLYGGLDIFRKKLIELYDKEHRMVNMAGRVRRIPEMESSSSRIRADGERKLLNSLVQGTAADWAKQAMLRIHYDQILNRCGYHMTLQVHDEILGIVKDRGPASVGTAFHRLQNLMIMPPESPTIPITTPIRVSGGIGQNWGDAK